MNAVMGEPSECLTEIATLLTHSPPVYRQAADVDRKEPALNQLVRSYGITCAHSMGADQSVLERMAVAGMLTLRAWRGNLPFPRP